MTATAELLRGDPRVDADRLGLWFFSGAGLLLGDWLREPPAWLRGLAATYPLLAPLPGWPPVHASARWTPSTCRRIRTPPLRRARPPRRRERRRRARGGRGGADARADPGGAGTARVAPTIEAFTVVARRRGIPLCVVDVPNGQHGFDALDHTEESRTAVQAARDTLITLLTAP
ncbi:hypothetical protein V2I01_00770 [Micromonospora sp. BRA006-A]|nr:hypothetical protein [Micromonospora sp. BRA006-A]